MEDISVKNRRAFDNWKVVGPTKRIVAFFIDGIIIFTIVYALSRWLHIHQSSLQLLLLWILGMWAWEGAWLTLTGATPGRNIFGLSVYSPRTDGTPNPTQVCLRILTFWISLFLLGAGLTPIIFRRDRRGWHDLISETLTVGQEKDVPTVMEQKTGQLVLLFQALLVFSVVGALLLTVGTGRLSSQNAYANIKCDSTSLLLDNTAEVLSAITISPAWQECWPKLQSAMGPIADSQLARMAELAVTYFDLWSLPEELRGAYFNQEIRPREDAVCNGNRKFEDVCLTARGLASLTIDGDGDVSAWLKPYQNIHKTLLTEKDSKARILFLKQEIEKNHHIIITSALRDRLWSEQLARGEKTTDREPSSANDDWNHAQVCWAEALQLSPTTGRCQTQRVSEIINKIRQMENTDEPITLNEDELDLRPREIQEYRLMAAAIDAKKKGQIEEMKSYLRTLSPLSPFKSLVQLEQ